MNIQPFAKPVRSDGTGSIFDRMGAETAVRTLEETSKRGTVTWSVVLTLAYKKALAEKDIKKLRTRLTNMRDVIDIWIADIDERDQEGKKDD